LTLCLALILLFVPLLAVANDECTAVLQELLGNVVNSESSLLSGFSANSEFNVGRMLDDDGGVYAVHTPTGKYVVRFGSDKTNVAREAFAIGFSRESPLKTFPNVRLMTSKETQVLKTKLKPKANRPDQPWLIDNATTSSVSVFYGAEKGSTFVNQRLYNGGFDRAIYEATTEARRQRDPQSIKAGLAKVWAQATPPEQIQFSFEMKSLFPELAAKTPEETFHHFYQHFSPELLESIEVLRFGRIPVAIRRQLADGWLLYTALGISDFHSGNWLLHKNTVLPIDLGFYYDFKPHVGTSGRWHPYNMRHMTAPVLKHLLQNASPEMLGYLRSVKLEDLQRLAGAASYTLHSGETDFILERIQELLREADRARSPKP
jgi:hypothetical protein